MAVVWNIWKKIYDAIVAGFATLGHYYDGFYAARNHTQICKSEIDANNFTSIDVHTVTAGKVFYLTSYTLSFVMTEVAYSTAAIEVERTAQDVVAAISGFGDITDRRIQTTISGVFPMPIKLLPGKDVKLTKIGPAAKGRVSCAIQGWEEDE